MTVTAGEPRTEAQPDFVIDLGPGVSPEQVKAIRSGIEELLWRTRQAALDEVRREVEALPWRNHTPDADRLAELAPAAVLAILDRLREPQSNASRNSPRRKQEGLNGN